MANRSKKADEIYNARRRYTRAAERYLDKAENSSGATAARYRQLANVSYQNAVSLYGSSSPAKKSAGIKRLEAKFGFDDERVNSARREDRVEQSFFSLESSLADVDVRREQEARTLLNDDTIGSRILGGLVDVWKGPAIVTDENGLSRVDNKKIVPALLDYFKVDSLADMISKLEDSIGSSLYDLKGNIEDIYEYVRITIAEKVRDNTLVQ